MTRYDASTEASLPEIYHLTMIYTLHLIFWRNNYNHCNYRYDAPTEASLPESYKKNSEKELLWLWCANNLVAIFIIILVIVVIRSSSSKKNALTPFEPKLIIFGAFLKLEHTLQHHRSM